LDFVRIKFIRILRIEMEDLWNHIESLVSENENLCTRGEETEYVCRENVAVLHSEECGLRGFMRILDSINPEDFPSVKALADHVDGRFKERLEQCGFAPAILLLAERKIRRVHDYVTHADGRPAGHGS
jgi:hypothetical protein